MPACGWTLSGWPAGSSSATPEQKASAEALAAHTLWALSGRVFGVCEVTVSPVVESPRSSTYSGACGTGSRWPGRPGCGCSSVRRVHLPGPVQSVTSVSVAGVELPAEAYEVHNRRWLVRRDGELWPLSTGNPSEFEVTYERGIPLDTAAMAAFGALAVHYLTELKTTGKCTIPARATTVSRQGIDIQLADPEDLAAAGRTGVEAVDDWLDTVNPGGTRRAPSRSYSVDVPDPVRIG